MKVIANIAAAILIFFGVMFIWSAFGTTPQPGNIIIGLVTTLIGFGLIWFAQRKGKQDAAATGQNVSVNIDLPGEIKMETMKCQACGGALTSKNIEMQSGAPMVVCPYCDTTYQLNEEPKW
jgi:hypothetical protein